MPKKSVAIARSSPPRPAAKKPPEKSRTLRALTAEFRREVVAMPLAGKLAFSVRSRPTCCIGGSQFSSKSRGGGEVA
jgi:hypothetical protein